MGGAAGGLIARARSVHFTRTMAKMIRNKAKAGIDQVARGARKAADAVSDASDKNKRPSSRVVSKVKAAADRAGDKVKQAGRAVRDAGARAKARAKRATR